MNDKIKVVIIDDHTLFRDAVAEVLSKDPQISIVGQGETAGDAIYLTDTFHPDIILLDLKMPGGGFTSARVLAASYPETQIIVLTSSEAEDDIRRAARAGIRAYVLKGVSARELLETIHKVHAGEQIEFPTKARRAGS